MCILAHLLCCSPGCCPELGAAHNRTAGSEQDSQGLLWRRTELELGLGRAAVEEIVPWRKTKFPEQQQYL